MKRLLLPTAYCLLPTLIGCTVGPNYQRPNIDTPKSFGATTQPATQSIDIARWWTTFNDPQLNTLIDRATAANPDLKIADSRIREARAARGVTAADLYPGVNVNGRYSRSRSSENSFGGDQANNAGNFGGFNPPGAETDLWQAGFDASWEIDVFGGVRRSVEAADADITASIEARRDTLVTLLAEVARNYLELRGFQQQIEIANRNIKIQQDAAEVASAKARLAGGSELDEVRALAQVSATTATIPQLEALRDQAAHRLAVLLGQEPRALIAELSKVQPIAKGPPAIPPGLPSDLLRRRPDVRRAEAELAAATARVGVATADLYPKFSLTGSFGFQSEKFTNWPNWGSRFWSIGPAVSWPLFDAGRIRANIRVQDERTVQALHTYQQSVLIALEDVENALVAYQKEQTRREYLAQAVARNRRAVELANTLYQGGARDFLNVIDAQRALVQTEDQLVQSDRVVSTNLVALYKALGGGWEP